MKKDLMAAIIGAVSTYIQQEKVTKVNDNIVTHTEMSLWWIFGHQEMMRARSNWRLKKINRFGI